MTLGLRGAIGLLIIATVTVAQEIGARTPTGSMRSAPQADQSAPGKGQPAFDVNRFGVTPSGTFETFHVTSTRPLREALRAGTLQDDTPVLVAETDGGRIALLADQMAYHHIAQGRAGNKDWMATF